MVSMITTSVVDRAFIFIEYSLFSSWYGWKIAHLVLNNTHCKHTFFIILFLQALWYTTQKGMEGSVFGSGDQWNGLGVFMDSFDNDGQVGQRSC